MTVFYLNSKFILKKFNIYKPETTSENLKINFIKPLAALIL